MKALFIMIAMIIIAGPAQAWEPENYRVAPQDEETCTVPAGMGVTASAILVWFMTR